MAKESGVASWVKNLIYIVVAFVILVVGVQLAYADFWGTLGEPAQRTPIADNVVTGTFLKFLIGSPAASNFYWEELIIRIMLFLILFVALADIIEGFTTFRKATAGVIAFGVAAIAGITGSLKLMATVVGASGALGAVGIMIIVLSGVASAVVLNMGLRGSLGAWRLRRDRGVMKAKASMGFAKVAAGAKGLKETTEAVSEGEEA